MLRRDPPGKLENVMQCGGDRCLLCYFCCYYYCVFVFPPTTTDPTDLIIIINIIGYSSGGASCPLGRPHVACLRLRLLPLPLGLVLLMDLFCVYIVCSQ